MTQSLFNHKRDEYFMIRSTGFWMCWLVQVPVAVRESDRYSLTPFLLLATLLTGLGWTWLVGSFGYAKLFCVSHFCYCFRLGPPHWQAQESRSKSLLLNSNQIRSMANFRPLQPYVEYTRCGIWSPKTCCRPWQAQGCYVIGMKYRWQHIHLCDENLRYLVNLIIVFQAV